MPDVRILIPALAIILAACTAGSATPTPTLTTASAAPAANAAASQAPPARTEVQPAGTEAPPATALDAWRTEALTDVRTGEAFAIADLEGKVVVIEPMAIWCSNCARQQKEASKALSTLASDDVVYISLDVDPGERASDLAAYADERGFDWRFVVADRAMSRALAQAFGDQVLSPPSTPKIIVGADGQVVGPNFGIQEAAAIEAELRDQLS